MIGYILQYGTLGLACLWTWYLIYKWNPRAGMDPVPHLQEEMATMKNYIISKKTIQPDITPYELALITIEITKAAAGATVDYDTLPTECKRHFRVY